MIRTHFIIVLISFFIESALSQSNFIGYEKLYNRAEYGSGNEKIIEYLYQSLQFPPELLMEPMVSVMIGVIEVSPSGKTIRVFSLNNTEPTLVNEFRRKISRLEDKWEGNNKDTTYFIIPIEFRNVSEDVCQPEYIEKPDFMFNPIVCMLDLPANGFKSDTVHMKCYEDFLYQHKYNKAMAEVDLLINRQPFNKELYIKKIRLYTYVDDLEGARIEEIKARLLFNNQLEDKSRTTVEDQ
jgi:hypothetical protein